MCVAFFGKNPVDEQNLFRLTERPWKWQVENILLSPARYLTGKLDKWPAEFGQLSGPLISDVYSFAEVRGGGGGLGLLDVCM